MMPSLEPRVCWTSSETDARVDAWGALNPQSVNRVLPLTFTFDPHFEGDEPPGL
jgi:hypothetical protein